MPDQTAVDQTMTDQMARTGLCIPRPVLEQWAGPMTDDEVQQLEAALADRQITSVIPHTVVPQAIATMVWALRQRDPNAEDCDECRRRIPVVDNGAMANKHHDPACSLYDPDEE